MKKFLSLVLALVMTMSLVTVSAGASFKDDSKINYKEAVEVMKAIDVIDGYADGSFNPANVLTRQAAAKIICNLVLGPTTADDLAATEAPYKDVSANSQFAGYIAYCKQTGIISGYADGSFRPTGTLTGYAFMKMLLGALGYDQTIEGYVGENWKVNVAKQALGINLDEGLNGAFNGNKTVNREEACLFALNTLKATMVEYDTKTTVVTNGTSVVIANNTAKDVETKKDTKTIADNGKVEFAEKYFSDLKLTVVEGNYKRPANEWKANKKVIGTYDMTPDFVYVDVTKEEDVYADLGKDVCKTTKSDYTWTTFVDGAKVKNVIPADKDKDWACTAKGTVTEIYVDDATVDNKGTVTVVEINQYIGKVTKVKDGEITVTGLKKNTTPVEKTFDSDEFKKDDYVVYTIDRNDDDKTEIASVYAPTVVTGEVTTVDQKASAKEAYFRLDRESTKYFYSVNSAYDMDDLNVVAHPSKNADYDVYMDANGYVLAFEEVEEEDQYAVVLETYKEGKNWMADVVFADGTRKDIKLDKDSDTWFKADHLAEKDGYVIVTVEEDDGEYEIHKLTTDNGDVYAKNNVKTDVVNGQAYITEGKNKVVVTTKTNFVDVDKETTYEGYKNVVNVDDAVVCYIVDNAKITHLFICDGDGFEDGNGYLIIKSNGSEDMEYDKKDNYYTFYKAYVDGEKKTVDVAEDLIVDGTKTNNYEMKVGTLYEIKRVDEDGIITKVETVKDEFVGYAVEVEGDTMYLSNEIDNNEIDTAFDTNDDTQFVVVEMKGHGKHSKINDIYEGDINDIVEIDDYEPDQYFTQVRVVDFDTVKHQKVAEVVYIVKYVVDPKITVDHSVFENDSNWSNWEHTLDCEDETVTVTMKRVSDAQLSGYVATYTVNDGAKQTVKVSGGTTDGTTAKIVIPVALDENSKIAIIAITGLENA